MGGLGQLPQGSAAVASCAPRGRTPCSCYPRWRGRQSRERLQEAGLCPSAPRALGPALARGSGALRRDSRFVAGVFPTHARSEPCEEQAQRHVNPDRRRQSLTLEYE